MTHAYQISFILSLSLFWNYSKGTINRDKVIEMAKLLCHRQDICSLNNSQHTDIVEEASTCCYQCFCTPTCTEYGNCCFPDQAYPLEASKTSDKIGISIFKKDTSLVYECLYPSSVQPENAPDLIKHQSFWMVSEILNTSQLTGSQICGNLKVAPWGSLLPVSSKTTGITYKNIFCAKEHNIKEDDIVIWAGEYTCKRKRMGYIELSDAYLKTCVKHFQVPNGIANRASSLCFKGLIDTCPNHVFPVPTKINMSPSEVVDACTSNFVSPYRQEDMYTNVFCHICNGHKTADVVQCRNLLSYYDEYKSSGSISGLIDQSYLNSLSRDIGVKKDHSKSIMACVDKNLKFGTVGEECKVIHCPFGQIRNSDGKCIYETLKWNNIVFKMSLQLKSTEPFNIRQYFPTFNGSRPVDDITSLKFSFPKFFRIKVERIHYKEQSPSSETDELVVFITKQTHVTETKMFMDAIKPRKGKIWQLKSYNSTLSLKSELANEVIRFKKSYTVDKTISYNRIYYKSHMNGKNIVVLTKLYFCENIQLERNEFNFSNDGTHVFNKVTNRFLYNNEYSRILSESNSVCRVCLKDSGYIARERNLSGTNNLSLKIFISVVCKFVNGFIGGN